MREQPNITKSDILSHLNASFMISARRAEFLPYGADRNAWAYRIDADEKSYFLKIRRDMPAQSMLVIPDYLVSQDVPEVVAPLRTVTDQLYVTMDTYALILYPMIDGDSAWEKTLSDKLMMDWGDIMRRIHQAQVAPEIANLVSQEQYISIHDALFKQMNRAIMNHKYEGTIADALAEEWRSKMSEIEFVYNRHLGLGDRIKRQNLKHVICHADIHQANIMIDTNGQIHIVDWDGVIIAPKERDLMFFDITEMSLDNGFFAGYQHIDVNKVAIAYYRYEWVVQEFAEWAAWIVDDPHRPKGEKEYALSEFKKLFSAGDVVETAHAAFDDI